MTQRIDAAGTADFTYVNGRPATVTDPVTRTLQTLGYNTAGQLATIDYGSGRVRTIGYDAYGRMSSDVLKAGTAPVSSITYGYDADNNVTVKNTTGVAGAGNNTYSYDQLGRLTSWTKGSTTTEYGWDANSNRVKAGTKLASYDERNRLLSDGASTYTYSARGALLSKTTATTTEAFSFDAFDRMITRSDRDFAYDALDRPVQAGAARMRYDGFSDEVVSDGTQFFGRSASDGLLSVGYETTKRLVLADRHGDIVAGFDPTDTTLAAGLPDTRTFDPFGTSTNASGLKYRVGYQGDWTDPRSGDVNQGARWYNPSTATFNSRDTITHNAGTASSVLNLYGYANGNPLTLHDPDGHRAIDPESGGTLTHTCRWDPRFEPPLFICELNGGISGGKCEVRGDCKPGDGPPPVVRCKKQAKECDEPPPPTNCRKSKKKNCDDGPIPPEICKTQSCRPKPPPPPACGAQCQLNKKIKREREQLESNAWTKPAPPPGDPSCANGNPALCPVSPDRPATIVGTQGDLTDETSAWSDELYKRTLNQVGSVTGKVADTHKMSWLEAMAEFGLPGSHENLGDMFGKWFYEEHPELFHLSLDILGLIPVAGEYFDGLNAAAYASEGNHGDAILSAGSMIPIAGWLPAGGKLGSKALKLLEGAKKTCRTNSFTADTRVLMADGTAKRIDQIQVGDQVVSTDPETGVTSNQTVSDVIVGDGQKTLIDITIEGKLPLELPERFTIRATDGHPFLVGHTWTSAADLGAGDRLHSFEPRLVAEVVASTRRIEHARVFNLTVSNTHTYYAVPGGSDPRAAVLVHNDNGPDLERTPATHPELFEPVRGTKGKRNKITGEVWEHDMLHKNHWEVYKNKKAYENGKRSRAVWDDGRLKGCF